MASFNNKIQIARGNLVAKGALAYGELFYDRSSRNLFIGAKDPTSESIVNKRIGGAEGLVLKGAVANGKVPSGASLVAGDTYFLSAPIYFEKNVDGSCKQVQTAEEHTKDSIVWAKDSIIIYLGNDIPATNSEVVFEKWLYVNSAFMDADHVKFDSEGLEWLTGGEFGTIEDIQTALKYLFKTNFAYAGQVGTPNVPYEGALNLKEGTFVYYVGETTETSDHVSLPENSLVLKQLGQIYTIPLGASDPNSIGFTFTQIVGSDKDACAVESKNGKGETVTITGEKGVESVTNALDWLNGTKADLIAGKIPLAQIPSTLIGALQFKGTVDIDKLIAASGNKDHILAADLVKYIKDTLKYDTVDEGDYVIFTKTNSETDATVYIDNVAYNSGDWAIYLPTHPDPETMSDADHFERINASAAVDNVNGLTASVVIEATNGVKLGEDKSKITITNDYMLTDANNVPVDHLPIKAETEGNHGVKDSKVSITNDGDQTPSKLTDHNQKVPVELKFPAESGIIATVQPGFTGETDFMTKFDEKGQIANSTVTNKGDTTTFGKRPAVSGEAEKSTFEISTGSNLTFTATIPSGEPESGTKDVNTFKLDMSTTDPHGNSSSRGTPATILTDISIIDCGEWN